MGAETQTIGTAISRQTQNEVAERDQLILELRRENMVLRQENQRLTVYRQMAYRDCLTGLHNRRYFEERLREECARANRISGYTFSVVLVDIDRFKDINDTLGHSTGDDVLVAIARYLKGNVREVDIPCRLGGDEFALLLPNTDGVGASVVERRLRAGMDTGLDAPCPVRFSMGVAAHPPGPADGETLVAQADTAMYLDKRRTRTHG